MSPTAKKATTIGSINNAKKLTSMKAAEARTFLLKGSSYCSMDLPQYFDFVPLLDALDKQLRGSSISKTEKTKASKIQEVGYVFTHNKDGVFAWRPFELVHPALYVDLVRHITTPANWKAVVERLNRFGASLHIECASIPVESQTADSDVASQIHVYWNDFEQRSLSLGLDYGCVAHCDISNCYGSLYTHSIAWALHGKSFIKKDDNRNNLSLLGNYIDRSIQNMRFGQTNGIAQGSVLMDVVAEIVLGYIDECVEERCKIIDDWKIIRYRDDYRIFSNSPTDAKKIVKALSEELLECGMQINPSKVKEFDDPIAGAVKSEKFNALILPNQNMSIQKKLMVLYEYQKQNPNAGYLKRLLGDFHAAIASYKTFEPYSNPEAMLSIIVNIALKNPGTYMVCSAIISKLLYDALEAENNPDKLKDFIERIRKRFEAIPNTNMLDLWLQRIALDIDGVYNCALAELVTAVRKNQPYPTNDDVWDSSWLQNATSRNIVSNTPIVCQDNLKDMPKVIPPDETALFIMKDMASG